jgi:hypothetical protein
MTKPYSLDLRERVAARVLAGGSVRSVASTFSVSVAIAQPLGQIAPAPTRAGHPQKRIEELTVIGARTALALAAARNQRLQAFPLIVAQLIAGQG